MKIKKQKKIYNRAKKKILILAFLLVSLSMSLVAIDIQAYEGWMQLDGINSTKIKYTPNVPIDIQVGDYRFDRADQIVEGGDFLASYIVGIYSYGAGFAGLIAMLMLVLAGWKWLLAGGNPQKIMDAKSMINGVLIGLALLFGGQLLLRQISEGFNSVQSLSIRLPDAALRAIELSEAQEQECERLRGGPGNQEGSCDLYTTATSCYEDLCGFGRTGDVDDKCIPGNNRILNLSRMSLLPINFHECFNCPNRCTDTIHYVEDSIKRLNPCECDRSISGS
jgi:hypothetical protein